MNKRINRKSSNQWSSEPSSQRISGSIFLNELDESKGHLVK